MTGIDEAAEYWDVSRFFEHFGPRIEDPTGALRGAVSNEDLEARVVIAGRSLLDGADVTRVLGAECVSVVHILLGQLTHDLEREPELIRAILDAGADVNWVSPRWGTPVQTLAGNARFTDGELAPFYDVFFARPDLDLLKPGSRGWSTLETVRRNGPRRAALLARGEQYLTDRGIAVPEREA